MKMYAKEELEYKNGYIVDKQGEVVAFRGCRGVALVDERGHDAERLFVLRFGRNGLPYGGELHFRSP